jgi:MFS family permease
LIIIAFLLFSFGFFSACSSLTFVLFAELVENDTKFISYYNADIVLAWALGSQSCGIFIDYYGIQYIFIYLLALSIINFFIVIFIKENRSLIIKSHNKKENNKLIEDLVNDSNNLSPISNSVYYSLFFRNFGVRPIFAVLAIIMGFYITSNFLIGFLTGINFFLQFFLIIIIGRIVKNKNIKIILIIGYFLSTLAIFGYIFSTNFYTFLLSQILFAFSYAMFNTTTQVYISQNTSPSNKGKYISYANSSIFLGSFIGGLFFTLLLAVYDSYYISMYFLLGFPIISVLIIILKFKISKNINQNSKKEIVPGL